MKQAGLTTGGDFLARHKSRKKPVPRSVRHAKINTAKAASIAAVKVTKAFELPMDLAAGMVHLDFSGNREVVVEGCRGVLEYDEDMASLDLGKLKVRFIGRGLTLRNYVGKSIIVDGFINSVEFLS